jgi:hypothetical protein
MLSFLMWSMLSFIYAPIAQLDRVTDYESVGRRFESCWAHQPQKHSQKTTISKSSSLRSLTSNLACKPTVPQARVQEYCTAGVSWAGNSKGKRLTCLSFCCALHIALGAAGIV